MGDGILEQLIWTRHLHFFHEIPAYVNELAIRRECVHEIKFIFGITYLHNGFAEHSTSEHKKDTAAARKLADAATDFYAIRWSTRHFFF